MKPSVVFTTLLLLLAACTPLSEPGTVTPGLEEPIGVTFHFRASSRPGTKATAPADEEAINSFQLILFRGGALYQTASVQGESVTLQLTGGTYDCYAVANSPVDWTGYGNLTAAAFEGTLAALTDNSASSFVMVGKATETVTAAISEIVIGADRLLSRVLLNKVTLDLSGTPYAGQTLTINSIFLTNVNSAVYYGVTPAGASLADGRTWYNKLGMQDAPAVNAFLRETSLGIALADGSSTPANNFHYFYACPNPSTAEDPLDTWPSASSQAPCTRLVLECTLAGRTCYYHLNLPGMLCNRSYEIGNCIIKNMGGPDPEHNLETGDVQFSLTVTDWITEPAVNETF